MRSAAYSPREAGSYDRPPMGSDAFGTSGGGGNGSSPSLSGGYGDYAESEELLEGGPPSASAATFAGLTTPPPPQQHGSNGDAARLPPPPSLVRSGDFAQTATTPSSGSGAFGGGAASLLASSTSLQGIRHDPSSGHYLSARTGKRIDPTNIYDRKIYCPEHLFTDKVITPLFRNLLEKYSVAYMRPCVLRRTAGGGIDSHVVRCMYIDAPQQMVQFVEESGQAKRAFYIRDVALVAVERPAKSILGVALAPTVGIVLKNSPAIKGSRLAAEAHARNIKREEEARAEAQRKHNAAVKKAQKAGLPPPPPPPLLSAQLSPGGSPMTSPRGGGASPSSPRSVSATSDKGGKGAPYVPGDSNDTVIRFEPFPPAKPAKGAPSLTSEEVRQNRSKALDEATEHMHAFIAMLRHFNPFIVVRGDLPHGIVSRMPLHLTKPLGKAGPPQGPPDILKKAAAEDDMFPPEESSDEEELELEEEEEEEVAPPPPKPRAPTPPPPVEEEEIVIEEEEEEEEEEYYVREPTPPPPAFVFVTRPNEESNDAASYPPFPDYSDITTVRDLFVAEGEGEGAAEGASSPSPPLPPDSPTAVPTAEDNNAATASSDDPSPLPAASPSPATADPLTGHPLRVAAAIPAFPAALVPAYFTDEDAARSTALTTVATAVVRCAKAHHAASRAKAKARRRHEAWQHRTAIALTAGQPPPPPPPLLGVGGGGAAAGAYGDYDDEIDLSGGGADSSLSPSPLRQQTAVDDDDFVDPYYDNFFFSDGDEDEEELEGVGGGDPLARYLRSGGGGPLAIAAAASLDRAAALPLPTTIIPQSPQAVYESLLMSPYAAEDARLSSDLAERRDFIAGQLEVLEKDILPRLVARRRRADQLLEEMAAAARQRGQSLAPTTRLAHPSFDRHVNLAAIVFDICRVRRQKIEYAAAMEAERAAGVAPAAYKHPLGVYDML